MAFTASITSVKGIIGAVEITLTVTDGTRTLSFPFSVDSDSTIADVKAYLQLQKPLIIATIQGVLALSPLVGQSV
jgi:hypothetical protein